MTNTIQNTKTRNIFVPLALLVLCVLAYGLLIPSLGYYWDDWPYAWINHMYGPSGYPAYVALDRPYSAWIFMLLTSFLGESPTGYHISALLLFWLCTILFWWLLRLIWPAHKKEALWASMLFAIYPGFLGHPQAIIYNHHFAAMALYFFSLAGTVRAIQVSAHPSKLTLALKWHIPALLALSLSQFTIEYFVGWEAVRLLLVWLTIKKHYHRNHERIGWSLLHFLPYWVATLGFLVWRVFIFKFPTYRPISPTQPDFVLNEWVLEVLKQFVDVVVLAWTRAFPQFSSGEFSRLFWLTYLSLVLITGLLAFVVLKIYSRITTNENVDGSVTNPSFGGSALLVALSGLAFAGWPFWLTDLTININSPFNSRFSMAFMPWIALLMAAVLHFLYQMRGRWIKSFTIIVLAMLIGGSTGYHLWNANFYRHQWEVTKRYFQQMVLRIPDLEPGTAIVINDLQAISLNQDDSLSAIMNWTYAPENTDRQIDYMVQYLSVRLGWEIPALEWGLPIEHPFRSQHFSGTTDQMLVVYYQPPGCLRVLDHQNPERLPRDFVDFMRQALPFSNLSVIQTDAEEPAIPPLNLFDEDTTDTWCHYFEEADLEAQRGDWVRVTELGDYAFTLEDQSNEVSELFIFIEGYLRTGQMEKAQQVSLTLRERSSGYYDQAVCKLWHQLETELPGGFDPNFDVDRVYETFCLGQ